MRASLSRPRAMVTGMGPMPAISQRSSCFDPAAGEGGEVGVESDLDRLRRPVGEEGEERVGAVGGEGFVAALPARGAEDLVGCGAQGGVESCAVVGGEAGVDAVGAVAVGPGVQCPGLVQAASGGLVVGAGADRCLPALVA